MLDKELKHFKTLSFNARELLFSYIFHDAAIAIVSIFIGAFIWRQTNNPVFAAIYYISGFSWLYISFLINGRLLSRFSVNVLYGVGLILMGSASFLLIALNNITPVFLIIFGALDGFGSGLYWANRNYLEIDSTTDNNRSYFFGIMVAVSTLMSIVMPFFGGLIIRFTGNYFFLMGIGFVIAIIGGLIIQNNKFNQPEVKSFFVGKADKGWNKIRTLAYFINFKLGIEIALLSFIILTILGNEFSLGIVQSLSAIVSAIFIYFFGKLTKIEKRFMFLLIGISIIVSANLILFLMFNIFALSIFVVLNRFGDSLVNNTTYGIFLKAIDDRSVGFGDRYRYFCDLELRYNLGRVSALVLFIVLFSFAGEIAGVRVAPAITAIAWIISGLLTLSLRRSINNLKSQNSSPSTALDPLPSL